MQIRIEDFTDRYRCVRKAASGEEKRPPVNTHTLATRRRSHLFILALIVALAAILRFFSLSALGYWTDELFTLSETDGWGFKLIHVPVDQLMPPQPVCTRLRDAQPFTDIPAKMARDDAHPPLYFMALRCLVEVWGDNETSVRSLNVMLSLIAIVLLFFAARDSVGSAAALVACLLMAVADPQIEYAQEARNYMPVLPMLLSAVICVQKLKRAPRLGWAVALGMCCVAMMLTHYFAVGVIAALALFAVVTLTGRSRRLAIKAFVASGLVYVVLWAPSLLRQRSVMQGVSWLNDDQPGHLHRRLMDLCRLPVRYFIEVTSPSLQPWIAIVGAMLLLTLPILFVRRRELRLWILFIAASITLVALADLTRSTTQLNWVRYSLFATPGAYVILAAALRGRWRYLPATIAAVSALVCLPNAYVPGWKTDYRTPVQLVAARMSPSDGLIIAGSDKDRSAMIFAAFQHYLPKMPAACAILTAPLNTQLLARMQQCPHVWIVWTNFDQPATQEFPTFRIADRGSIPYFAEILRGSFKEN